MEIWKHLKTDSLYLVLGEATCSTNGALEEGQPAVVYYSLTYQRWFYRKASEFYDGRFVKVDAPDWRGKLKIVDCEKCDGVGSYQWCHGGETMICSECNGTGQDVNQRR
jgi:formylmethanofuran dehydrogenase subunit E